MSAVPSHLVGNISQFFILNQSYGSSLKTAGREAGKGGEARRRTDSQRRSDEGMTETDGRKQQEGRRAGMSRQKEAEEGEKGGGRSRRKWGLRRSSLISF